MFIAHAPAGYLASRLVGRSRAVAAASMIGALLPDVDMLWFYVVDHGRVHHHRYWTHLPIFWAIVALITLGFVTRRPAVVAFFVGIATHLVLDTVVGDIAWLLPFSDRFVHLVDVKPAHAGAHWIVSFVTHWTIWLEIVIVVSGMAVAVRELGKTCSRVSSRSTCSESSAPSMSPGLPGFSGE